MAIGCTGDTPMIAQPHGFHNAGLFGTEREIANIPTDELCWMICQVADLPFETILHPLIWPRYRLMLLEAKRRFVDEERPA